MTKRGHSETDLPPSDGGERPTPTNQILKEKKKMSYMKRLLELEQTAICPLCNISMKINDNLKLECPKCHCITTVTKENLDKSRGRFRRRMINIQICKGNIVPGTWNARIGDIEAGDTNMYNASKKDILDLISIEMK